MRVICTADSACSKQQFPIILLGKIERCTHLLIDGSQLSSTCHLLIDGSQLSSTFDQFFFGLSNKILLEDIPSKN
jgi:hypothetical protein